VPELPVPVDFLLGSPSPWVRYRTRTALLGEDAAAERREVLAHPLVRGLLREARGWPAGSRGDHRAAKDLLNKVGLLADFGVRAGDPGVEPFVEAALSHADPDGRLLGYVQLPRRAKPEWMLDIDGQDVLLALVGLGYGTDGRVRRALAGLLALEAPAGGWVWPGARSPLPCRRFDGGCPYPTLKILRVLAADAGSADSAAARGGTELLLSLWERRRTVRRYGFGMGERFGRLRYPFVRLDVLHVLEALSPYPWTWGDPRFRSLLGRVLEKADAEGRFTPESVYLPWTDQCFGQKREPSPWLTLVVHRILSREPDSVPASRRAGPPHSPEAEDAGH
jgi:hypothetical protein